MHQLSRLEQIEALGHTHVESQKPSIAFRLYNLVAEETTTGAHYEVDRPKRDHRDIEGRRTECQ